MDEHEPDEVAVLRQAQAWVRELPGADYDRRRAFSAWIKDSPDHLKAFLQLTFIDAELAGLQDLAGIDLGAILARLSSNVVALPRGPELRVRRVSAPRTSPGRLRRGWTLKWAMFAALVVFLMAAPHLVRWQAMRLDHAELVTAIGQRRTFRLPDGTAMQLDTNSAAQLAFSVERRELTLFRGRAWIRVARDANRPFTVNVGSLRIRDIGTVFMVRAEGTSSTIYVVEGRVQISGDDCRAEQPIGLPCAITAASRTDGADVTLDVAAGEEAVVPTDANGAFRPSQKRALTPGESAKRIAWTQGRLVLAGEPLRDLVREINRYHQRQMMISDPELEQIEMGGVVDPADSDYRVIVRALSERCPIRIDDSNPGEIRLFSGQSSGSCASK